MSLGGNLAHGAAQAITLSVHGEVPAGKRGAATVGCCARETQYLRHGTSWAAAAAAVAAQGEFSLTDQDVPGTGRYFKSSGAL